MFDGSKSRLPAIITFTDGKQLHCEIAPGSTPGLMSAISGENVFLDVHVEGKRKYYLRQHILCVEEDTEAVKLRENAA
jgi:hypothetical protein